MYTKIRFHIVGLKPLIMHNNRLVNPMDPVVKRMKAITSKPAKQKTEEDMALLMDLEWEGGLYFDEKIGPYIPGGNVEVGMERAAIKFKKGFKDKVKAGVTSNGMWPLEYDGPRDMDSLRADIRFRIVKPMNVQRNKVNRCRPFFDGWRCKIEIDYDTTEIEADECEACFRKLATGIGLCDERPRYGRFDVEKVEHLK